VQISGDVMAENRQHVSPRDFDLKALYAALDEARQTRGLTWAQAAREINAVGPPAGGHPIAVSTITGLRLKTLAEGAGVLQMIRWLGRIPESFAEGAAGTPLPAARPNEVLRFDTRRLFDALDAERRRRGGTWADVARETGVPASHARGLARGGRTAFPGVMRLTQWLGRPIADFVRVSRL